MKEEPLFLTLYDAGTMDYQGPFQWGRESAILYHPLCCIRVRVL